MSLSLLLLCAIASACGIGDEVIVGGAMREVVDAGRKPPLDAGNLLVDASNVDAALVTGTDAGLDAAAQHACKAQVSDEVVVCQRAPEVEIAVPVVKWRWPKNPAAVTFSAAPGVIPLVANLDDDNHDGAIDDCDVPDVIVTVIDENGNGLLWMIAGDTGESERALQAQVNPSITPAIADLDADGVPEIVTLDVNDSVIALAPDGTLRFTGDVAPSRSLAGCHAVAVADLDLDGKPEILIGFDVFDRMGRLLFSVPGPIASTPSFPPKNPTFACSASMAADIVGDAKLELLVGDAAYDASGNQLWSLSIADDQLSVPQVANLDDDPEPELVLLRGDALYVLEHDGGISASLAGYGCSSAPLAIADFDGDGRAELALPWCMGGVYRYVSTTNELSRRFAVSAPSVNNVAVSAFDLYGRGHADAIYASDLQTTIYDGKTGAVMAALLESSPNQDGFTYPVIADVDADGSADILLAGSNQSGVVITMLSEPNGRFAPARHIWNQHAYHVTQVRENGSIPSVQAKSWQALDSFHANAQIENGKLCKPELR